MSSSDPLVQLAARHDVGGGLILVELAARASGYATVGQYVRVRLASEPDEEGSFFALASDPHEGAAELLIRPVGPVAEGLAHAELHRESFFVSEAMGSGYPAVESADGELAIVVTAGALSIARAAARARIREGHAHRTHVYVGALDASGIALRDELAAWVEAGVAVTACLAHGASSPFRTVAGFTQHAVRADVEAGLLPRGTTAWVAGIPEMVTALQELAAEGVLGAAHTNF